MRALWREKRLSNVAELKLRKAASEGAAFFNDVTLCKIIIAFKVDETYKNVRVMLAPPRSATVRAAMPGPFLQGRDFYYFAPLFFCMKRINFFQDVVPHIVAIAIFLVVTLFFFKPVFFDNRVVDQHDITQFKGSAQSINEYREQTGEEALWAESMFSGMPAYLVSVQWGNKAIAYVKTIASFGMSNVTGNIYIAFVCFYILLLVFGVRPYLAIAGAIAFGLSSYMIVGVIAGHNGRIGAIAFVPLVIAGIHLVFTNRRLLGFGVAAMAIALHLRENHLQITYYLMIIAVVYGLVQLIYAVIDGQLSDFVKNTGVLVVAAILGAGTFVGQFWAISEYTKYSIRGKSEIAQPGSAADTDGLTKEYAFRYNYGILEPMTLFIPEFYGGSSSHLFVQDQKSSSYQALVRSTDEKLANQLAYYTGAYWGPQSYTMAPYYAGAIVVFLFVLGIIFAPGKYVWWLVPLAIISIFLSWGDSFKSFNYFLFDHLPGYNKFRSFNFALMIILVAMPLLGFIGLEKLLQDGVNKENKKKLLFAGSFVGGICLLLFAFAGGFEFHKEAEVQLPPWFLNALVDDRMGLFRSDVFRSFFFILVIFALLYLNFHKKVSALAFYAILIVFMIADLALVNKRYVTDANYKRKREANFVQSESDKRILQDKSYYRVFNLNPQDPYGAFSEANTSYFHHSIGGYHGAKMRRYQDFADSCLFPQLGAFIRKAQAGDMDFSSFTAFNMLNVKYIMIGTDGSNVIPNPDAYGNGWFVSNIQKVNSPREELAQACSTDLRTTAVIDGSQFTIPAANADTASVINLVEHRPNYQKYESTSGVNTTAVFSEIYYPGWKVFIDGKESTVLRANYLLRALEVPAGKHVIEFKFEPDAYFVGNKITTASSWVVLLVFLGSMGWAMRRIE